MHGMLIMGFAELGRSATLRRSRGPDSTLQPPSEPHRKREVVVPSCRCAFSWPSTSILPIVCYRAFNVWACAAHKRRHFSYGVLISHIPSAPPGPCGWRTQDIEVGTQTLCSRRAALREPSRPKQRKHLTVRILIPVVWVFMTSRSNS